MSTTRHSTRLLKVDAGDRYGMLTVLSESMASAFPAVRAVCIEHYTAHGLRALLSRWLQRIFN